MTSLISLLQRVRGTIEKHRLIGPSERVLVGVSGGADSVGLLHALVRLGFPCAVAHVNHGWRGSESDGDERFVSTLACELGLRCFVYRAGASALRNEAAARNVRQEFYTKIASAQGYSRIALGHTLDDRRETFLLNLMRGAGPSGMSAMRAKVGRIIRPLIETERKTLVDSLRNLGTAWRVDQSNYDAQFARNRLRIETIPSLEAHYNPNLGAALDRTIEIIEAEDLFLDAQARAWLQANAKRSDSGWLLDAAELSRLERCIARRVVRIAMQGILTPPESDLSFDRVEAVVALAGLQSGKRVDLAFGLQARLARHQVVLERTTLSTDVGYDYALRVPGQVVIAELKALVRVRLVEGAGQDGAADLGRLGSCVRIRNWKQGDYYRPVGRRSAKLEKHLQRVGIPIHQRQSWPVAVSGSDIVWVKSLPISYDFAWTAGSGSAVVFEIEPE